MSITPIGLSHLTHRCMVCKRREATQLCDKVIGEFQYAGHPPRTSKSKEMACTITCDRELCKECAVHITGMDLCPQCAKEIKIALGGMKV